MDIPNNSFEEIHRDIPLSDVSASLLPAPFMTSSNARVLAPDVATGSNPVVAPFPTLDHLVEQMSRNMLIDPGPSACTYSFPPIENAAVCLTRDIILPPDLIHGVLHRGAKAVLGGGSKSFKTFMLADLAISVATGRPWLGFPTTQGKVLYLNLELQPAVFHHRLQTICRAKEVGCSELADLAIWNLRGYLTDFSALIAKIIETVRDQNYSLIVVDPIYKALAGRDENKAGDITSLLNELENLAVQTGAAVIFGAHFSKGNQSGKESIDRIGGSGVFARDPDAILVVTRHEANDAYAFDAILRAHAPIVPFVIRWEFPLMRRDDSLDPGLLRNPAKAKRQFQPQQILELLGEEELAHGQWLAASKEVLGMSASAFERLRTELRAAEKIIQTPSKKWRKAAVECTGTTIQATAEEEQIN